MTAQLIDGNALSAQLRADVARRAAVLRAKGVIPGLAVILVGDSPASQVYVRNKVKGCNDNGLHSVLEQYPADLSEAALVGLVERMLDQAKDAFSEHQHSASRDALLAKLTSREAQVLERIVAGRLNKQIADDLGISIKTVEAHRANIMEKLNANTVADLLKIALGSVTAKA